MKKTSNAAKFEKAQYDLYTYIDWLYKTGRLTLEEHSKLINDTAAGITEARLFGQFGKNV
jgi:hypothetical protein